MLNIPYRLPYSMLLFTVPITILCPEYTVPYPPFTVYMREEQHTLIPPQLHPAFVLTKAKLRIEADQYPGDEDHQEQERESRLA